MGTRLLSVLAVTVTVSANVMPRGTEQPAGLQASPEALTQAYAAPVAGGQEKDIQRLLSLLPREDGRYVYQGDLFYTEAELRKVLRERNEEFRKGLRPQIIVRLRLDGHRDVWDSNSRSLTYSIDLDSFGSGADAEKVRRMMEAATTQWVQACPECDVRFAHKQIPTNRPGPVTFVVRKKNSATALASAFFPSWSVNDRYLNLGERAVKDGADTQGIIRHELGHVLGYEHENYQNPKTVPGCVDVKGRWQPLTPYDPQSVMHHFCGEDDATRFTITDLDRRGHRELYGPSK